VTGRRTSSTASSVGPSTTWATLSTTTPPTCPDATTSGSCSSWRSSSRARSGSRRSRSSSNYCYTRRADGADAAWIRRCFRDACARLGSEVHEDAGRLVVDWAPVCASVYW